MSYHANKNYQTQNKNSLYLALHRSPRSITLPKFFGIGLVFIPIQTNLYRTLTPANIKKLFVFFKNIEKRSNLIIEYDGNFLPPLVLIFVNICFFKLFKITLDCHVNSYIGVKKFSVRTIIKLSILYIFKILFRIKTLVHNKESLRILKKSIYCPSPLPNINLEDKKKQNKINDILIISSLNKDEPVDSFIDAALELKALGYKVCITGNKKKLSNSQLKRDKDLFTGFLKDEDYFRLIRDSELIIAMTVREYNLLFAPREALQFEKICLINSSIENIEFYKDLCQYCIADSTAIVKESQKILKEKPSFKQELLKTLITEIEIRIHEVKQCLYIK